MAAIETVSIQTYNYLVAATVVASALAYTRFSTNVALGFVALLSFLTAWSSFMVTDASGNIYAAYSLFGVVFVVNALLSIITLVVRIASGEKE